MDHQRQGEGAAAGLDDAFERRVLERVAAGDDWLTAMTEAAADVAAGTRRGAARPGPAGRASLSAEPGTPRRHRRRLSPGKIAQTVALAREAAWRRGEAGPGAAAAAPPAPAVARDPGAVADRLAAVFGPAARHIELRPDRAPVGLDRDGRAHVADLEDDDGGPLPDDDGAQRDEDAAAPPEVRAAQALRQGMRGDPIELPHRAAIEARLGRSLAGVRCFTGAEAQAACALVGAHAFAVRDVIVFADGAPGLEVALHEAIHVVQQGGLDAALDEIPARLEAATAGEASEVEAHRVGERLLRGDGDGAAAAPTEAGTAAPLVDGGADDAGDHDATQIGVHGQPRLNGWLSGCSGGSGNGTVASKTVTVNVTHMHGSSGDIAGAINYANSKVYPQAGVTIAKGVEVTVSEKDTKAALGEDMELEEYKSPSTPTDEEKKLFAINQHKGSMTMYFVKGMSDGSTGEAFWPALGHGFVGFVNNSSAIASTWSHELGHVLLDSGTHDVPDSTYLMYGSKDANKYKLKPTEITKIKSSPYAR